MKHPKVSLVLLGLGILLLIVGVALKTAQDQRPAQVESTEVKEQTIPMSIEDFKGEPRLQGAIEQQVQQQQKGSVQITDGQGASSNDSQLLQPVPKGGIQATN